MSALVFCTNGNNTSGIGHVMRCQALAQAADEQGIDSIFVVNGAARSFIKKRHDWVGKAVLASEDVQGLISQIHNLSGKNDAKAVIIDGYQFEKAFFHALSEQISIPLVLFDDIQQSGLEYVDVICNPAGEKLADFYAMQNPTASLCLGSSYRLLRSEFSRVVPLPLNKRYSLTINMGGSDPRCLTLPILKALTRHLPEVPFRVITGPAFAPEALNTLNEFISSSTCAIQHVHDCQDMADAWNNARLAVVAAGGSQFELAACHTPSVLLTVAENQREASTLAAKQGWCEVWNATVDLNLEELAQQVTLLWRDEAKLIQMQQAAAENAITDGAWSLLNVIVERANKVSPVC